jgi:hypothetical protein
MAVLECSACRTRYSEGEWGALPVAERIPADEVSRLVRGWPPDAYIEVRSCEACGHAMATRRVAETA